MWGQSDGGIFAKFLYVYQRALIRVTYILHYRNMGHLDYCYVVFDFVFLFAFTYVFFFLFILKSLSGTSLFLNALLHNYAQIQMSVKKVPKIMTIF